MRRGIPFSGAGRILWQGTTTSFHWKLALQLLGVHRPLAFSSAFCLPTRSLRQSGDSRAKPQRTEFGCSSCYHRSKVAVSRAREIDFKEPLEILMSLDAALRHEKLKYEKSPVGQDFRPEYEMAQAWGYVVAAYALLEQSFKALLHVRGKQVPKRHSLDILFSLFEPCDMDILGEYYTDYRSTAPGMGSFPFETLGDFIDNLDGDTNDQGTDRMGSFDWRYSPIERVQSRTMPTVSIDYLHEVIYGCIRIVEAVHTGKYDPSRSTRSWRMYRERELYLYRHWYLVRASSKELDEPGDRLEILWGPDYRSRYDWQLFQGESWERYFRELPKDPEVPVVDKRKELSAFDAEAEFRKVGMIWRPPSTG